MVKLRTRTTANKIQGFQLEIIPFLFNDTSEIRTFKDEHENIWFVAKDILTILQDNNNPNIGEATKDLDSDERGSFKIMTFGGVQEMTFVSESGLYSLIIRSRKPIAKPFQKWVTHEVLPSIRKTGNYSISQTQNFQLPEIGNSTEQIIELKNDVLETSSLIEILESKKPTTLYRLDKFYRKFHNFSVLEHFEIDLDSQFFLPTELGKMINKSPVEVNLILEHKGFQLRENGIWKLTEIGRDFGIEINGKFSQIKWKIKSIV